MPPTAVTTSPACKPAFAAAPPGTTCAMTAPPVPFSTDTPRYAPPEVDVDDPPPARSFGSSASTLSDGIANPMFCAAREVSLPVATSVLIPTTRPAVSTSGPPLLPGLMAASVWIRPVRLLPLSEEEPDSDRFVADTIPSVTVGEPP